jgi:hypothetical protein
VRVTIKPGPHLLVFVSGIVVKDYVDDLTGRDVPFGGIEEAKEFLMPGALHITPWSNVETRVLMCRPNY